MNAMRVVEKKARYRIGNDDCVAFAWFVKTFIRIRSIRLHTAHPLACIDAIRKAWWATYNTKRSNLIRPVLQTLCPIYL